MKATAPRHLVTLWNPAYASDAMDAHLRVLLDWAARAAAGAAARDEVYVWWAKIRSRNRPEPLPHLADIAALQGQIDDGIETQLYLTDYRSLYVAELDEITTDDVLGTNPDEVDHAPEYYQQQLTDVWFRVLDLRRLVADDTPAVIDSLKRLRDTRYHERPVSLYGGMRDLPLIVTLDGDGPTGATGFSDRAVLTSGRLWAQWDAELHGETARMGQELRDNLIGREIWARLEPASTAFLASAEAIFRSHREDPGFDFSACAVEYAKAVETELNALLFRPLRRLLTKAAPGEREVYVDGHLLDLGGAVPHQTLGVLEHLLRKDVIVRRQIGARYPSERNWLLDMLPNVLQPLADVRNPAAHSSALRREDVVRQREEVLGIGGEGLIVKLARARMRAPV